MVNYDDDSIDYSDIPPMADANWQEVKMVALPLNPAVQEYFQKLAKENNTNAGDLIRDLFSTVLGEKLRPENHWGLTSARA